MDDTCIVIPHFYRPVKENSVVCLLVNTGVMWITNVPIQRWKDVWIHLSQMGLWCALLWLGLDLKVALAALTFINNTSFTENCSQHQPWVTMSAHNNLKKLEHQGCSQQGKGQGSEPQSLCNNRQYFPCRCWKCKSATLKNKWQLFLWEWGGQGHSSCSNAIQDAGFLPACCAPNSLGSCYMQTTAHPASAAPQY